MGVKSCSRLGCERIMVDTYIPTVGYVCWECQNEFKEYLKANAIVPSNESGIKRELEQFMETIKDSYTPGDEMDVDDFFDSYTE